MANIYRNQKTLVLIIFAIFILIRLPGLDFSYHQDEMKWDSIGSQGLGGLGSTPHPPLTALVFIVAVGLFGIDHLRYMPFLFSAVNFWLLYILLRYKFSWNQTFLVLAIYAIGFFSVLASMMVDTDGQVLPFFFIISLIAYYKWKDAVVTKYKISWGLALIFFMLCGFLVKLSFAIAIAAIFADFVYSARDKISYKLFSRYGGLIVAFVLFFTAVLLSIHYVVPAFNLTRSLVHWKPFFVLSTRNYLQILIQVIKVLFYASPLLFFAIMFLTKELANKLRPLIMFLIVGLVFYLVIFDFSPGALDRYLQFIIVPLSIISGVVISHILESSDSHIKIRYVILGVLVSIGIFMLQFLPHFVPALYPKTEWFNRALAFKWNFVFPFTGGSGPTGFYVSWLFIALIWILTIILTFFILWKNRWHKEVLIVILILGFLYNGVFIEEYLFGKINGNSNSLIKDSINFIKNNKDIIKVITYNNIGGSELSKINKYERRLFIAPKYEANYVDILKNFNGHYLVIDIPQIDPNSPYTKYFSNCQVVYQEFSHKISSKIYNCQKVQFH